MVPNRVPTFFWGDHTLSPKGLTTNDLGTRFESLIFESERFLQNRTNL